jgi:hypothetical protein
MNMLLCWLASKWAISYQGAGVARQEACSGPLAAPAACQCAVHLWQHRPQPPRPQHSPAAAPHPLLLLLPPAAGVVIAVTFTVVAAAAAGLIAKRYYHRQKVLRSVMQSDSFQPGAI